MIGTLIAEVGACQGCGACLLTCPEHAIRPGQAAADAGDAGAASAQGGFGGRPLEVRADLCSGCGQCQEVCPVDAIEMRVRP